MVSVVGRSRNRLGFNVNSSGQSPILVSGAHRSGTTWVGKVLATAPSVFYLHEPFNFGSPNTLTSVRTNLWYPYLTEQDGKECVDEIGDALQLNLRVLNDIPLLWRHPKAIARRLLLAGQLALLRCRPEYRVLIKDPLALLAAPWFERNFGAFPLILIRHPAAFVSSLKIKQWYPPFQSILSQPRLMDEHFRESAEDIARLATAKTRDIVSEGAFFWKLLYEVVGKYQRQHAKWLFIRHEDASREPHRVFQKAFLDLGLKYTPATEVFITRTTTGNDRRYVLESTSEDNVVRNSIENVSVWKERLSNAEVDRIRETVGEVGQLFYSDDEW
jgi:hypothetical protein